MLSTPIHLSLDRDLPVPLGAQLRGLFEYGITCGEFRPGDRLPSVRELAEEVGVAPMTVAQVYRGLKAAGLIEGRAGSGTYVAHRTGATSADHRLLDVHRRVDALIDDALAMGLSSGHIAGLLTARLAARQARGRMRQIVLVGIFAGASVAYARTVAKALGESVAVEAITIDDLQRKETARHLASAADLVLTIAHRRREVAALLPHQRVVAISFIPSEVTRRALASLDPRARVLAVSRFPEFLPLMRPGVQRFAPHVASVAATTVDAADLEAQINGHDVVVYATGAEAVLDRLPPSLLAIEYRHSPDLGDVDRIVRPLLEGGDLHADRSKDSP